MSFSASQVNGVIEKIQSIIIDIFFGLCYYNKAPLMKEAQSKGVTDMTEAQLVMENFMKKLAAVRNY